MIRSAILLLSPIISLKYFLMKYIVSLALKLCPSCSNLLRAIQIARNPQQNNRQRSPSCANTLENMFNCFNTIVAARTGCGVHQPPVV
ncbi:hypothetical protein Goklo_026872 [Gossypium klotzschianum]|uniref:Uncharacterized protein n=1 Tax=Gossypium klotzschianum TaxID=34286 RepID=A0A7J8TWI0_9ROSI|nr:hypothetical protein [Gossypium klotzschianum]